jgi:hypothetical protein
VQKETKMRFRKPARKLVVLFNQRVHDHLNGFQVLQHHRAMFFSSR